MSTLRTKKQTIYKRNIFKFNLFYAGIIAFFIFFYIIISL